MSPLDFPRLRRALSSRLPIVGRWRRRRAIEEIEQARERPATVRFLADFLDAERSEITEWAARVLGSLQSRPAREALCTVALRDPQGPAAAIALAAGYEPTDEERACLFLFVTCQLDRYFDADYEFQNLRLEYDRATPELRAHILSVLRSGDPRCLGFFGTRKKLTECTSREIMLALGSFRRHRDCERLFRAFLELPLKYGLPILGELATANWEPEDPVERSLLRQALAERSEHEYPPPRGDTEPGKWLERQLRDGRTSEELRTIPEPELVERLRDADPAEGVALVSALAARGVFSLEAAEAAERSPHWLVRFAAASSGIFADLGRDAVEDDNFWIQTHAPRVPVLEFWPQRATPAHLEALTNAPSAAWQGALGAARRVLKLLLAHRVTTGQFDAMVVEGDVFAGSFELVDDDLPPWSGGEAQP